MYVSRPVGVYVTVREVMHVALKVYTMFNNLPFSLLHLANSRSSYFVIFSNMWIKTLDTVSDETCSWVIIFEQLFLYTGQNSKMGIMCF